MPSLRRTMSSPVVRSSPYPSLSSGNGSAVRTGGNGHRRSSGSDVSSRRVLADIEWWRVTVGQHDLDAEQELEDNNGNEDQVDPAAQSVGEPTGRTDIGLESTTVLQFSSLSSENYLFSPTEEYGVLAIPPQTPPRRHLREGSASSLESTPEIAEGPVQFLRLGIEYLELGLTGSGELSPPSSWTTTSRTDDYSSHSTRPRALADSLILLQHDSVDDYPDFDISPFSSSTPAMFN